MAKAQTHYVCQQCGYESLKWVGRCPDCGEWGSLTEEVIHPEKVARSGAFVSSSKPVKISEVSVESFNRFDSGIGEFNRVLGGGIVPGSLVLIGGDPGIGKSTLLMQVAGHIAGQGPTLYVTGEESTQQVKMRADRLEVGTGDLLLVTETEMDSVISHCELLHPKFLIIDSIQTMHHSEVTSASGTVSQVRACTRELVRYAKSTDCAVFIVGHVNKDGAIAGPRVLEHMVDTVLYFEGDRFQSHRILRAVKNRFGSTDEIGLFEMREEGLAEIHNASELLLSERPEDGSGSVVVPSIEGTRPIMVEVQSLVSSTYYGGTPRRAFSGVDYNKTSLILAVLEKRVGLRLGDKDVFINVTGGLKVVEPALDLGTAIAIASNFKEVPIPKDLTVLGEVGLSGEIRSVSQVEKRLREASRLGFKRAILSSRSLPKIKQIDGIHLIGAKTVREAIEAAFGSPMTRKRKTRSVEPFEFGGESAEKGLNQ